jgi:hypothetical protein
LPAFARSLIVANFVCGIEIQGFGSALIGALVVGVVNALVRPVMVRLTSPLTIITFGLFLLVINGPVLWLVSAIVSGIPRRVAAHGPQPVDRVLYPRPLRRGPPGRTGAAEGIPPSSPVSSEDTPSADGERDIEKRKRHEQARKHSGDRHGK